MKIFRIPTAIFFMATFMANFAIAQSSPASLGAESAIVNSNFSAIENAKRALDKGMPALAQNLSRKILNSHLLQNKDEVRLIIIDSLIEQGNFDEALAEIKNLSNQNAADILLRKAISKSRTDSKENVAELLSQISPDELSSRTKPWFYITRGLLSFDAGNFKSALSDFNEAKNISRSKLVTNEAEILSNLCKMSEDLSVTDLNALAKDLEMKTSLFLGLESGAQFAKQYAIVLDRLGRKSEALEVISDTLDIALLSDSDKDELAIISSSIEPSFERKRLMLVDLLKITRSPRITEQAIYLLRNAYDSDKANYRSALLEILKNGSPLVRDRILLELSYDALRKNDLTDVIKNAQQLLEEYPASAFVANAYGVLAWAAFSNLNGKKPEYRLAARYLTSLANLQKNQKEAVFSKMLAADCYFLDGDYQTASDMYKLLVVSNLENRWRGGAFGRAVESLLNLSDISAAVALADSTYSKFSINPDDIWRAEWAISNAYKEKGNLKLASKRIEKLLSNSLLKDINYDLRARLLWLQTKFAENEGDWDKTLNLSQKLLNSIKNGELKASASTADAISSSVMLIKARTLANMGNFDGKNGAFQAYDELRKTYPKSDAAQISYLYEARIFASRGAFAQAQQHCKKLADLFADGVYADTALYDAALYSRKLGLESDYKEALSLLNRLVENYPTSPKVFFAKIAQAEILRLMGDFANAGAIYRNVVNTYESHPQVRIALMGLGDCYLAQNSKESDASSTFEKLYYLPDMPDDAKAEAAFKWGFALSRSGRVREATEVWWISANNFLKALDSNKKTLEMGGKQKYWVARTLLELAKTLELAGDKTSAASAYTMIVDYDLPGANTAKSKLLTNSKK